MYWYHANTGTSNADCMRNLGCNDTVCMALMYGHLPCPSAQAIAQPILPSSRTRRRWGHICTATQPKLELGCPWPPPRSCWAHQFPPLRVERRPVLLSARTGTLLQSSLRYGTAELAGEVVPWSWPGSLKGRRGWRQPRFPSFGTTKAKLSSNSEQKVGFCSLQF